jgi:E3 ubiquitin-protein ligase DOA10
LAAARADKDRWGSEPDPSKRYVMMNREIAERKERERREREAAQQNQGKDAAGVPAPKADGDLPPQE